MFFGLGGDASRPSYFEVLAADRLLPSLQAALSFSAAVLAQRRPGLHRLLDWEAEVFALLAFILNEHSLRENEASFAEALYGLKRAPLRGIAAAAAAGGDEASTSGRPPAAGADGSAVPGAAGSRGRGRPRRQRPSRALALLFLVGVPYLKAKLDALHGRALLLSSAELGDSWLDPGPREGAGAGAPGDSEPAAAAPSSAARAWPRRLRRLAARALLAAYPWLHAGLEGSHLAFQVGYLLERTAFPSPGLWLQGLSLVRAAPAELAAVRQRSQARRQRELAWARRAAGPAAAALLRAWHGTADYARGGLVAAVLAFKLAEWWFVAAEERLSPAEALPVPPPPPAPRPHPAGAPCPADPGLCPLCACPRTNPAVAATSGFVFCYPCLFAAVSRAGACPVTRAPTALEDIRKLYEAS